MIALGIPEFYKVLIKIAEILVSCPDGDRKTLMTVCVQGLYLYMALSPSLYTQYLQSYENKFIAPHPPNTRGLPSQVFYFKVPQNWEI
jgi:hypothetical protein